MRRWFEVMGVHWQLHSRVVCLDIVCRYGVARRSNQYVEREISRYIIQWSEENHKS